MTIDWLKDINTGEKFYPITHEDAVIDDNGDILSIKLTTKEDVSNKVTSLSSGSTNTQYPSAKAVYDALGDSVITSYDDLDNRPKLSTTATTTLSTSATETITGTISLHKVSKTGKYGDLVSSSLPKLSTTATTTQTTSTGETITGTISLHKVSKTGKYSDLIGTPAIGTLTTTATTTLTTASSESFSDAISLHKVSKTGSYNDLLDTPTLGTAASKPEEYFALSAHTHGNISNTGRVGTESGKPLITTTNGLITTGSFGTNSGQFAAGNHTHGNITTAGALQTTDVAIANGDKLVITDSSDSNKIARSSLSFDGSTTTVALTKKGTFEAFAPSALTSAYAAKTDGTSPATGDTLENAISKLHGLVNTANTSLESKVDKVTSTDNAIVRFDGTGGAIQNSGVLIDDSNNLLLPVATSTTFSDNSKLVLGNAWFGSNPTGGLAYGVKNGATYTSYYTFESTTFRPVSDKSNTIDIGTTNYKWKNLYLGSNAYATKFITSGGTSSQFVKGDGTLDSNTYLTAQTQANWTQTGTTQPDYIKNKPELGTAASKPEQYFALSGHTHDVTITATSENTQVSLQSNEDYVINVGGATFTFKTPEDTHYTAVPVAGGQTATTNATSDTTDPYVNIVENSAKSGGIQFKGSGGTTVKAKNGIVTISTPTNYASTTHTHGNITSGGTITADTAIANGAKIVITDANGKVSRSPLTLTNNSSSYYLNESGIWSIPPDTKNTTSSNDTNSKIYIIGATSQTTGSTWTSTYSHDTAYVGTDGCLYSDNKKVATLDSNGKIPSEQLPSYVDDVIEGYYKEADGKFYSGKTGTTYSGEITGETGKIYVDLSTNKTYRWGGSAYAEIVASPGTTDDITEGTTNLYFTNQRAQAAVSASLATKIDKVTSTDNAIVRFDGTAGSVQNSSTSIDDSGNITATSFKKTGGTSSQFLKADGSVDSSTYLTAQTQANWTQTGTTQPDYIKNKPTLGSASTKDTEYFSYSGHSHGNITSGGTIGTESGKPLITDVNGLITTGSFGTNSGQFAAGNHTHGNITTAGALQTTDVAIANGDKLVITDASNSNKVARASLTFDASTVSVALTKKGTFEAFAPSALTSGYAASTNDTFPATGDTLETAISKLHGLANSAGTALTNLSNATTALSAISFDNIIHVTSGDWSEADDLQHGVYKVKFYDTIINGGGGIKGGQTRDATPQFVGTGVLVTGMSGDSMMQILMYKEGLYHREYTGSYWSSWQSFYYNKQETSTVLSGMVENKVDKVSSSDNAIVRFDGTEGDIQSSSVFIDDSNNVTTAGNIQGKNIIVRGTNTSNTTRFITSDAANNMYVSIGGIASLVITNTEVRRGVSSNAQNVTLGTSATPWKEAHAQKFVTTNGTSSQFVKGDGSLDSNTYLTSSDVTGFEQTINKVTGVTSASTDTQYPSAKCLYKTLSGSVSHENSQETAEAPNYDPQTQSVSILEQTLTQEQQAQVRENIGVDEIIGDIEELLDEILGSGTTKSQKKLEVIEASGTTLNSEENSYYHFDDVITTLAITLPSVGDTNHINQVIFNFTTGSNPLVSFEASPISGIRPSIYANEGFSIDANTTYEINAIYNGNTWVLAAIRIDATDISS